MQRTVAGDVFTTLLSFLGSAIDGWPEPRGGKNTRYAMSDIAMSAFACFFCQSPSFLAFQRLMEQGRGINNAGTMFGVEKLPTDNQIRNVLDEVDPAHLQPVFRDTFAYLQQREVVESFRSFANTLLVAIDGTGYFYSEKIHCQFCTVARHRNGRVSYSHHALLPAVVTPEHSQVIPLEPEYILPQEGHKRQDCELVAAQRWINSMGPRYGPLAITLLGDALYAVQPLIELVVRQEMDYLFVAKPSAHKHLYEELESIRALGEIDELTRTRWTGRRHETLTYRYLNDVTLTSNPDSVTVNWVELTITAEGGKVVRHAFVTNHLITPENVEDLVAAGRCRWKIENEEINTLKTKGYHFEHNFGHGKQHLSESLLSLNILAFLFHTVLELLDEQCSHLRKRLPRRDTFFQHIATLTQYLCFASWQSLLRFMIRGLQEGPRPPPDPSEIIH